MNPAHIAALNTNVLLLKLVADTDKTLVESFKRVNSFQLSDIPTLGRLLERYQGLVTTPPVLAETSNFLDQAPAYRRDDLLRSLSAFVRNSREAFVEARRLIEAELFQTLGLTDTGLVELSTTTTVITTDHQLWGKILAKHATV